MIKALIFDFDGLILDTESPEFQAWQEVFTAHGHELRTELWADLIGRPRAYFDMYSYFKELNGVLTDIDTLRKDRRARVIELVLEQPILPGIRDYLSEARQMGLKIGLASSSGGDYVRGHLKRLELFDYFHVTKCLKTQNYTNPILSLISPSSMHWALRPAKRSRWKIRPTASPQHARPGYFVSQYLIR
jgi:beta-phosphoglucomutase-like phosphatase (HAD superfamily)